MSDNPSPQSLCDQGKKAFQEEDFPTAAQQFEQAAMAYEAAGQEELAAEMWNNCSVARLKAGDAREALALVQGSDKVFARAGNRQKQAMALGNQAAALEALHQYNEALDLYLQSNQILKEIDDQELRPYVLQCIAGLQLRTGRQLEALVSSEVALDMKKNLSVRERLLKKLLGTASRLLGR